MGTEPSPRRSDMDEIDPPVTPEVEAELRKRLETFDDSKVARPWEDVLADLKARRPAAPPSPR